MLPTTGPRKKNGTPPRVSPNLHLEAVFPGNGHAVSRVGPKALPEGGTVRRAGQVEVATAGPGE